MVAATQQDKIYERPSQLERLTSTHKQIMELHLKGVPNVEIARQMGRTQSNISLCINQPLFQHALSLRRQELNRRQDEAGISNSLQIQENLKKHTIRASEVIGELLESPDENIKFKSVKQLLDMHSGLGQGNTAPIIQVSADRLAILVMALQESRDLPVPDVGDASRPVIGDTVLRSVESVKHVSAPDARSPSGSSTDVAEGEATFEPAQNQPCPGASMLNTDPAQETSEGALDSDLKLDYRTIL